MRVLYLGNNRLGLDVLRFLREEGAEVVGLALHPEAKRRYGKELLSVYDLPPEAILPADRLQDPDVLERVCALEPDLGVSVLFDYILRRPFLDLLPRGVVNLHPSLLPYNRGQYPNVWSIVERTPAGVTLHSIDEGIDTGDVIDQQEVEVEPIDTGESLYRKLEATGLAVFRRAWPALRAGTEERRPQPSGAGTSHRTRDVDRIDRIELDGTYTARELIDVLRARTFPPYRGAWFEAPDGRKVLMRLSLAYDEPREEGGDA